MVRLLLAAVLYTALSTVAHARCFNSSYYGYEAGSRTASGQRLNVNSYTAAHRTLPFGTVLNLRGPNGNTASVTINDRGPFVRGRDLDVTKSLARHFGLIGRGHGLLCLH